MFWICFKFTALDGVLSATMAAGTHGGCSFKRYLSLKVTKRKRFPVKPPLKLHKMKCFVNSVAYSLLQVSLVWPEALGGLSVSVAAWYLRMCRRTVSVSKQSIASLYNLSVKVTTARELLRRSRLVGLVSSGGHKRPAVVMVEYQNEAARQN